MIVPNVPDPNQGSQIDSYLIVSYLSLTCIRVCELADINKIPFKFNCRYTNRVPGVNSGTRICDSSQDAKTNKAGVSVSIHEFDGVFYGLFAGFAIACAIVLMEKYANYREDKKAKLAVLVQQKSVREAFRGSFLYNYGEAAAI